MMRTCRLHWATKARNPPKAVAAYTPTPDYPGEHVYPTNVCPGCIEDELTPAEKKTLVYFDEPPP